MLGIDLNSGLADAMVLLSDTASVGQMPFLCFAATIVLISRNGLNTRCRTIEAAAVIVAMLIALAGNAALNESVLKPAIGIARPNIVKLAADGVLGQDVSDADAFYMVGTKGERRALLAERLTPSRTPELSSLVRAHWIHEAGYSMPSGHATAAMTFATLWVGLGLAWLQGWRAKLAVGVFPIWAAGIVLSRLLLGVHTLADVLVGSVAGIIWGLVALATVRFVVERSECS